MKRSNRIQQVTSYLTKIPQLSMGINGSIQRTGMPQNSRVLTSQALSQTQVQSGEKYDLYMG